MDGERFGKLQAEINRASTLQLLELLIAIVTTIQWRFVMNHLHENIPRDTESEPEYTDVEEENDGSTASGSGNNGESWDNNRGTWGPHEPPEPPPWKRQRRF